MATEQTSKALVVTLTQALARIDDAEKGGLWPATLTPPQRQLMAHATLAYGLDPLMQELTVYQGKPLVTIRGRRRKDAEAGHHPSISFRFLTQEEKAGFTEAGAFHDGDLAQYCILTTEDGNTVEGFGKCTKAERNAGRQPVARDNPIEMCQKRAEDRARLMAYGPIPIPQGLMGAVLYEYQLGEPALPDATPPVGSGEATPALPEQAQRGYFCADHNVPFGRHQRGDEVWYSHRLQDGSWHNMKDRSEEAPPAAADAPFDPEQEPPLPLPAQVHSLTHFEAILKEHGWNRNRLEIEVLGTSLERYEKDKALDQAYQLFRQHLDRGGP